MFYIGPYKIPSPYILAPMAGISEMPFRRLALCFGASLAPTELISAKGLFYQNYRTQRYLTYDKNVEKPFCVQLFGGEPDIMAQGAIKAVEAGADIIDINMGCPVKKVTKTQAGSALLKEPKRAAAIVSTIKQALPKIPVTAKIRAGWDEESLNSIEVARYLQDAGCDAIAMHARTCAQAYRGKARWELIAELKDAVQIPVIGNGDISTIDDSKRIMQLTGCDGVMIGRAALGNPWIFKSLSTGINYVPSKHEVMNTVLQHFDEHCQLYYAMHKDSGVKMRYSKECLAVKSFINHLMWYCRGFSNSSNFRKKIVTFTAINEVKDAVEQFFSQNSDVYCDNEDNEDNDDHIDYKKALG